LPADSFATVSRAQRLWRNLNLGIRHNALNSALSLELSDRGMPSRKSNS